MSTDNRITWYNNAEITIKPKINHLLVDFDRVKDSPITKTCEAMDRHGSNKNHRQHVLYTPFYDALFQDLNPSGVLEFGIGSQDGTMPYSMCGQPCQPGGSLRAWRELFPNAQIFGADMDKNILFKEERLECYYVDAFDFKSIVEMWQAIKNNFPQTLINLIVDDAHHSLGANLNFLHYSLKHLEVGGYYVIEDINRDNASHINGIKEHLEKGADDAVLLDIPNYTNGSCCCIAVIQKTTA